MSPRKILVCGGAGFIGSHLVDRFMAEGHEIDVVDNLVTGSLSNLAEARNASGRLKIQNIAIGSAEFPELVAMRAPDIVVNLAAFTPAHHHLHGAIESLETVVSVLEAARRAGATKVVSAIPAALLYGEVAQRDLPIKEGHINDPRTSEEVLARAAADMHTVYRERHGIEFTVLAMANVYGPRQRGVDGVVASFAESVAQGRAPIVHGTGKQTRDFVYVDDAVDALSRALDRAGGLVINVGTGVATSVSELWSTMGGTSSAAPRVAAARPNDIVRLSLSPVRARIQLGWSPFTSLAQGLAQLRDSAS